MPKGIIRNLDNLGRVTLPMEMRRSLDLRSGDPIDIYFQDDGVICLDRPKLQCVCCGSTDEKKLVVKNGVHMCPKCIEEMRQIVTGGRNE
jgi:transcriptional pleiotropic regulator of transition state genes